MLKADLKRRIEKLESQMAALPRAGASEPNITPKAALAIVATQTVRAVEPSPPVNPAWQQTPGKKAVSAIPMLSACLLLRDPWPEPKGPWWRWDWSKAPLPIWTVGATVLGAFGLLWLMAAGTGFDGVAAAAWGAGLALLLLLAHRAPTQPPLLLFGSIKAKTLTAYVAPIAAYAALFGIGGFVLLWRSSHPGLWASLSVTVPLALLAVLYARLSGLVQSLPWASASVLLAGLSLLAAERAARHRPRMDLALAAYAAGVTAAIALAAAVALHAAWLTVALALELPALAWTR